MATSAAVDIATGAAAASIAAAPMHGEVKLRAEGLRTRDGHLLEWFASLRPSSRVAVYIPREM